MGCAHQPTIRPDFRVAAKHLQPGDDLNSRRCEFDEGEDDFFLEALSLDHLLSNR